MCQRMYICYIFHMKDVQRVISVVMTLPCWWWGWVSQLSPKHEKPPTALAQYGLCSTIQQAATLCCWAWYIEYALGFQVFPKKSQNEASKEEKVWVCTLSSSKKTGGSATRFKGVCHVLNSFCHVAAVDRKLNVGEFFRSLNLHWTLLSMAMQFIRHMLSLWNPLGEFPHCY